MSDKIGEMRARIQFVFREIKEDKNGEFLDKKIPGNSYWARMMPINMMGRKIVQSATMDEWNALEKSFPKKWYKIGMRNFYNRDALQATLFGLRFNSKLIKLAAPFTPSLDGKWVETLGFEC